MKVTLLNGALTGDSYTDTVAAETAAVLAAQGWQVQSFHLAQLKLGYCLGCFECWVKTPGVCRIDDAGQDIAAAIIASDLVIYVSPVTFGGYSSELKKALDRTIGLILPFFAQIDGEVHHQPRYERYPGLLGIGVLPQPEAEMERIFSTLLGRNAINMHAPGHSTIFVYRDQDAAVQIKGLFTRLTTPGQAMGSVALPAAFTSASLPPRGGHQQGARSR